MELKFIRYILPEDIILYADDDGKSAIGIKKEWATKYLTEKARKLALDLGNMYLFRGPTEYILYHEQPEIFGIRTNYTSWIMDNLRKFLPEYLGNE